MQDVEINVLYDILDEMTENKNKFKFQNKKYLEYSTKEAVVREAIFKLESITT